MKHMFIIVLILSNTLFYSTIAFSQNTLPVISKLIVTEKEQGEQGVVQTVVRGVARDAEDGMKLNYEYRILKGDASLTQVKRYAILNLNSNDSVLIELLVTDSEGGQSVRTVAYKPFKILPEILYTDKTTWKAAIGKTYSKNASFSFQQREDSLSNVLIIGNSISIGYTSYVQKELRGVCNVNRIPTNGGDTKKCIENLDLWLGDRKWDVIHFNFGMHDFKRLLNNELDVKGKVVMPIAEYADNLELIVQGLKSKTRCQAYMG
ncbi:SGNH/GDSL hydrolase family protein [Labilibacter sediminis]|nr:SGNH/GDSL hydrolase family protein [Labilibacter sediminis]